MVTIEAPSDLRKERKRVRMASRAVRGWEMLLRLAEGSEGKMFWEKANWQNRRRVERRRLAVVTGECEMR